MDKPTSGNLPPAEKWAQFRGLRVRFLDWGGTGFPLLALHGLSASAHWYDLAAPFLRPHFRLIVPDLRGHGKTSQADTGYDWPTLSSDATDLLDSLEIPQACLVGHSWGGDVAMRVAIRAPERTRALVLVEGGLFHPAFLPRVALYENFRRWIAPRTVPGVRSEFLESMRRQHGACWSRDVEQIVLTTVHEDAKGRLRNILRPENHEQVTYALWAHPASKEWENVSCPTLIVVAASPPENEGSEFPRAMKRMVQAALETIPDSRAIWIPDAGHDLAYEKPAELARAIVTFLSSIVG